jgi:hypothetical protein
MPRTYPPYAPEYGAESSSWREPGVASTRCGHIARSMTTPPAVFAGQWQQLPRIPESGIGLIWVPAGVAKNRYQPQARTQRRGGPSCEASIRTDFRTRVS